MSDTMRLKNGKRRRINEFQDWMPKALKEHIDEGWSVNTFLGKHLISGHDWPRMKREHPELLAICDEYLEKLREKNHGMMR